MSGAKRALRVTSPWSRAKATKSSWTLIPHSPPAKPRGQTRVATRRALRAGAYFAQDAWPMSGLGVGGLGLGVGTYTGLVALHHKSKLDSACHPGCPASSAADIDGLAQQSHRVLAELWRWRRGSGRRRLAAHARQSEAGARRAFALLPGGVQIGGRAVRQRALLPLALSGLLSSVAHALRAHRSLRIERLDGASGAARRLWLAAAAERGRPRRGAAARAAAGSAAASGRRARSRQGGSAGSLDSACSTPCTRARGVLRRNVRRNHDRLSELRQLRHGLRRGSLVRRRARAARAG